MSKMAGRALAVQPPVICFSHLRWDFVLQRPQHLMTRFARDRRVFFFEEHIPTDHHRPYLEFQTLEDSGVVVVRPRVPQGLEGEALQTALAALVHELASVHIGQAAVMWFYTPMMFSLVAGLDAVAVVYDCMDELANFRFAPPELKENERTLLSEAEHTVKIHLHNIISKLRAHNRTEAAAWFRDYQVRHLAAAALKRN